MCVIYIIIDTGNFFYLRGYFIESLSFIFCYSPDTLNEIFRTLRKSLTERAVFVAAPINDMCPVPFWILQQWFFQYLWYVLCRSSRTNSCWALWLKKMSISIYELTLSNESAFKIDFTILSRYSASPYQLIWTLIKK